MGVFVQTSLKQINGNWDLGYSLDNHVLSSVYLGDDQNGHPRFDTTRSEVGQAMYQLKYQNDWTQVDVLAKELAASIYPKFGNVDFLIPMPASKMRAKQPVTEVARALGHLVGKPVFENLLVKKTTGAQLKDMTTKEEKVNALKDCFDVCDEITNTGVWNALLVDDLFDTGASLEAACAALRHYPKIKNLYVATLTYKR